MDQPTGSLPFPPTSTSFAEMATSQGNTTTLQANKAIRQYFEYTGHSSAENNAPNRPTSTKWTDIPEIPTEGELMDLTGVCKERKALVPPNVISQPWRSSEQYLEAHYKLLREDTVAPLRDAILWVRENPSTLDKKDVFIYEKVHFIRATMTNRGMAFRIRFSTKRAGKRILWKYSSRLIPGTLVALSPDKDCFQTKCVVAIVAARPLERVSSYPPEIDIYFANTDDMEIDSQKEWVMVESRSNYFEATRHTLAALQKLAKEKFPLSRHICQLEKDVKVSPDIQGNPVLNFQQLADGIRDEVSSYNVLNDLPTEPLGNLNQLQWQALKAILTQQLVLVQGPPGTGKTHVSIVALKILLSNMATGAPPIIVAAHTNHALDQLIRQVATFEKNYVRLGGRSNDVDIRQRTLYNIKLTQKSQSLLGGLSGPARKELRNAESSVISLLRVLECARSGQEPLQAADFFQYDLLTKEQVESLKRDDDNWEHVGHEQEADPFKAWLGDRLVLLPQVYENESNYVTLDDIDEEYEQLREIEAEQGPEDGNFEDLKGRSVDFDMSFCGKQRHSISENKIQQYLQKSDLWKIPVQARGSIYNYLRSKLLKTLQEKVRTLGKQYADASKGVLIGTWERDYEILRKAKLIAMTTTGLSKYRGLVASVNPKIVLIEEAAEVIEAPVAVACFESIQQLILVGDHKQLKGSCSVFDLTGDPFHLDVSMFERLTRNKMPFFMLREQRRMTPEVSDLLQPIYGQLENHSSVLNYPPIPGMGNIRSFFFSHQWQENGDSLSSKLNEMEALMLVEFYVYLLMNGTLASSITIITFYNGQRKLLLKMMRNHQSLKYLSPKVMTVDSYQGEENDIVLLSLVRSNSKNGIGFLAVENRVCVALSRAKRGFFLFGNGKLLASVSPLWSQVLKIMDSDTKKLRTGSSLRLTCQKHGNHTDITVPGDWRYLNGGCHDLCRETLKCGHICDLKCHGYSHKMISCNKPCSYVRPCCNLACTAVCGSLHTHSCSCISETTAIGGESRDVVNNLTENVHSVFPGEVRVPHKRRALRLLNGPTQRQKIFDSAKPSRRYTVSPKGKPSGFSSRSKQFVATSHQKWNAFSDGGAKEMDQSLQVLARAEDLESEDVKRALKVVDPKFLPKDLLERLEKNTQKHEEEASEIKEEPVTDSEVKGENGSEDANQYPLLDVSDTGSSVPEGMLIDLSF
ncbi:hypothetical protein N7456_005214 [Penicillium angulare]|uniref:Uncharacterized protein n=1 Tax=Penicillium angulare TaxID=116970 RepID=A0A9W9KJ36_9EURO|nr:hypothetical protein N7456_005214 [Penicillium angulare]